MNTVEIPLTQDAVSLVDDADVELVKPYRWYLHKVRARHAHLEHPYAMADLWTQGHRAHVAMHRLIMAAPTGMIVDHINGNGLDNRRANLRLCTKSQNNMNRLRRCQHNTSGVTGVYWDKANRKWAAQIRVDGRLTRCGEYINFKDAVAARRAAELRYYGNFAPQR